MDWKIMDENLPKDVTKELTCDLFPSDVSKVPGIIPPYAPDSDGMNRLLTNYQVPVLCS